MENRLPLIFSDILVMNMRELRRTDRQLPREAAEELLVKGEYGVLSTVDEHGQPYGVPVNYVYRDRKIYLHSALQGHKLENIAANEKVSFCVVGRTRVLPEQFATEYESAIAFGTAAVVVSEAERFDALWALVNKYSPEHLDSGRDYIDKSGKAAKVVRIDVTYISGKARR